TGFWSRSATRAREPSRLPPRPAASVSGLWPALRRAARLLHNICGKNKEILDDRVFEPERILHDLEGEHRRRSFRSRRDRCIRGSESLSRSASFRGGACPDSPRGRLEGPSALL